MKAHTIAAACFCLITTIVVGIVLLLQLVVLDNNNNNNSKNNISRHSNSTSAPVDSTGIPAATTTGNDAAASSSAASTSTSRVVQDQPPQQQVGENDSSTFFLFDLLFGNRLFQVCQQQRSRDATADDGSVVVSTELTTSFFGLLVYLLFYPAGSYTTGPCPTTTTTPSRNELASVDDLVYRGAFRLFSNGAPGGVTDELKSANYAVGTLAWNPYRQSLFLAGHAQSTNIAEYPIGTIMSRLDTAVATVADLPETMPLLQEYTSPIELASLGNNNPSQINRITGLIVIPPIDNDDTPSLLVNAENWYDTSDATVDTTVWVPNAHALATTTSAPGFYRMSCRANGAGYMGQIPNRWKSHLGGGSAAARFYTGWSSVYSINGRYSHGPSLWTFDWTGGGDNNNNNSRDILTTPLLNYPFDNGNRDSWLSARAVEVADEGTTGPFPPADPMWNDLSAALYGFFCRDSFVVVGSTGGPTSGIGYKAVQTNGNVCGGPCSYDPNDNYNYIWMYAVDDILAASVRPSDPRPYYHGIWKVPFDNHGGTIHRIIGATLDAEGGILYVALENAGQLGPYDPVPLIVTFSVPTL